MFGDLRVHGADRVRFYTRSKAVTSRWPQQSSGVELWFSTITEFWPSDAAGPNRFRRMLRLHAR